MNADLILGPLGVLAPSAWIEGAPLRNLYGHRLHALKDVDPLTIVRRREYANARHIQLIHRSGAGGAR